MAITFEFEFVDDVIVYASNCGKKFNIINIIKVTIKNRQSRHTGRRQTKQLNNKYTTHVTKAMMNTDSTKKRVNQVLLKGKEVNQVLLKGKG